MSPSSNRDDQLSRVMPDLPGDPYGRDTDLYPPVPEFPRFDFWDESSLESDFDPDRYSPDLVVHDRYSELPGAASLRSQDQVSEPTLPQRRRSSERLRQSRFQPSSSMDIVHNDAPSREESVSRQRRPRRPQDDVTSTTLRTSAMTADAVTGMRPTRRRSVAGHSSRNGGGAWSWTHIVMPSFRQMLEQGMPAFVMAVSLVLGLIVIDRAPSLEGLWAPIVIAPSVALFMMADKQIHPMWRRCAMMNLASVGVFYPLLIVRQSYLRVPYVEWGNGTLRMPMISTLTVVVVLAAIALAAAWMSQEDPEYAGVLFLPAAMLVPFFAGATEIVSLRTALIIAAGVFFVSGFLTIVASMLPGAYPMLVAPVALALEFMVLPLSDSVPIFPMGAGVASKLLFFVLLATTVGLTASMPSLANWVRQVRDYTRSASFGATR